MKKRGRLLIPPLGLRGEKEMKKALALILVFALIAALAACETDTQTQTGYGAKTSAGEVTDEEKTEEKEVVLTSLSITKDTTAYRVGAEADLTDVKVAKLYSDGTSTEMIGYSALEMNGILLRVYFNGEVFDGGVFEEAGTYYLYAYFAGDDSISAEAEITVTASGEVYPDAVSILSAASMTVGDVTSFKVSFSPSSTTVKNLSWESSDPQTASVDANGNVTALKAGSTVITVTAAAQDGLSVAASCSVTVSDAQSAVIDAGDQSGSFVITTANGKFTSSGGVYTITSAGDYDLSGSLEGRIVIDAGEDDVVVLNLNGLTVTSTDNSAILALNADSLKINVKAGTENTVYDTRSAKTVDSDDQGEGAISAHCDLTLAGSGKLYVEGSYNNGVHTTKDLVIKEDLTLDVKAPNNALKGKDSVTICGGTLEVISTAGDGIKTEDTDVSAKGNQRGTVTIENGSVTVYAAGDGIQAAFDFVMNGGELTVYTASNSSYTSKSASVTSYKGIKAANRLDVNGGRLTLCSYDDGLHADYGAALENGSTGQGIININDGVITVRVNSSVSRYVSGADAIHADNTLNVNGGTIDISSAYEGLEATVVNITGGDITVNASDDGINAARKINAAPAVKISGGRVDITMGGGDTDGIDSNGSFTMTGGFVIVRGAPNGNSSMATGLDCDGVASISGGTFIQLGPRETVPTLSGGALTLNFGASGGMGMGGRPGGMGGGPGGRPGGMGGQSGTQTPGTPVYQSSGQETGSTCTFTSGTWTLSGLNVSFTVASGCTYYGATVYSSALTSGTSYTLSNGSTSYTATAQ